MRPTLAPDCLLRLEDRFSRPNRYHYHYIPLSAINNHSGPPVSSVFCSGSSSCLQHWPTLFYRQRTVDLNIDRGIDHHDAICLHLTRFVNLSYTDHTSKTSPTETACTSKRPVSKMLTRIFRLGNHLHMFSVVDRNLQHRSITCCVGLLFALFDFQSILVRKTCKHRVIQLPSRIASHTE